MSLLYSNLLSCFTFSTHESGETAADRPKEREFGPGSEPSPRRFRGSLVDSLGALVSL